MNKSIKEKREGKQPRVRVFSTPACPYCFTLKELLKGKKVAFEDIDVSQDKKAREEMAKKTGKLEVPVVDIGGQFVVGFDKGKIEKLLNIRTSSPAGLENLDSSPVGSELRTSSPAGLENLDSSPEDSEL